MSGAWLGIGAALASALGYGCGIAVSRLAYEAGAGPLAIALVRYVTVTVLVGAFALAHGVALRRLPARVLLSALWIGVLTFAIAVSNLGSVTFIPVSLMTLVFYTNPLVIALLTAAIDRRWPRRYEVLAVSGAFLGLAVALEVRWSDIAWQGVALAAASSCMVALIFVGSARLLTLIGPTVLTFWSSACACVVGLALVLATGAFDLPRGTSGVGVMVAVTLLFVVGVTAMFLAIARVGPLPTAMLMNLEPVAAILTAVALLGERLGPRQIVGAVLVIGSVALMEVARARDRRRAVS
ncbi:MAG: DMT family transporter [Ectothiorhodospiraceae bacterium]|nr:DMT family transporter [Chromatiales bacterium]MCP5154418.1 DMT family transporter [Ectothiorhodospiraceae bacterium]